MIHLLEIGRDSDPAELKKKCRRLAMTGGFEVALTPNLLLSDLQGLAERYVAALEKNSDSSTLQRSSTVFRVLLLIAAHPLCDEVLKTRIESSTSSA